MFVLKGKFNDIREEFEVSKIFIPHYDFGLVKKDFNNIKNYLKGL